MAAARSVPPVQAAPPLDPAVVARSAGLRYVNPGESGLARRRRGRGFVYVDDAGKPVRDKASLARIRRLAIPPAWDGVWICPDARGHIQAYGRDARGRKQYRYHERWREVRDATKFHRMIAFGHALPGIRRRVERDLGLPGLPREKVLAAMARLLETTYIRVGNAEYRRANNSHGLSTLRDHHVDVRGGTMRFRFRGKGGKLSEVDLHDPRLARIVKRCQDVPGQHLFQYVDEDGAPREVSSTDVNDYLREVSGDEFTAKDFRTWAGTLEAWSALLEGGACESRTASRRALSACIRQVAQRLGNTPAVARRAYVHPAVLDGFLDGSLQAAPPARARRGLDAAEATMLAFLEARAKEEVANGGALADALQAGVRRARARPRAGTR